MQETWVWSLGWEDPLEKEMATHSSIAWIIPWTQEAIVQAVAKSQANLCFVCFSLSISLSVFFNLSPPLWFVFIGRNIQTLLFHIGHSRSFFLSKQDL